MSHQWSARFLILTVANLILPSAMSAEVGSVQSLEAAIASWSHQSETPAFQYDLVDLNEDSLPDAIVLMTDPDFCGSGGCSMLIFRGTRGSFELVSASTLARRPILILKEASKGWRSLSVMVAGGGAKSGQALMRFDGSRYPRNPSVQPLASASDLEGAFTVSLSQP